ncbi:S-adenosyl-L-methionine-dependent methyltransferase [Rhodofomes roseus]|uniref:tRNA (cytosine(38)-C(5))-methyltransferase n=1 Tax=Rhodofomes roseus TaxID=34475 RepID=A0ABQ8KGR0_9APHY|nr:S-adenosyl-L-methionine-dependent methyltransferase [Rhodofomes roseus]KAH9836755.1 S-adenosyl-L-methionine-dependent methyltransferase [Rhodofomes roseus]
MPTRALEFYSGIGGLHRALTESRVDGQVVRAFDWDQSSCRVYAANYGKDIMQRVDISTLDADALAAHQADLWLMSPSCQPYTVLNPLAKGAEDPRAKSFIHIIEDVLPRMVSSNTHPRYMLIENVAGFETSSTRQRLLDTLSGLGYNVLELLLTPLQFGIPNSRLRYYLLVKAKPLQFANVGEDAAQAVWRHIPGLAPDWVDTRMQSGPREVVVDGRAADSVAEIRQYLDPPLEDGQLHPCAVPDRVLEKWGRLFDIILPSARRSCCFTRGYSKMAERSGSVLQMNEELDTTSIFDRFLAAQALGQENAVRILDPLRLRYFSPTELLRIFCFVPTAGGVHEDQLGFLWPEDLSVKAQYRLIGNSVNVRVVMQLINYLFQ